MQETVALKELEPNPYRGLDSYPLVKAKLEHLKESVQATGLWPRLMGRRRGKTVQIAYGHHLRAALEELYPPAHKIEVEVREFTDTQMFQMMARENMAEYDSTPVQDILTVKELLAAVDRGEIEVPKRAAGPRASRIALLRKSELSAEDIGQFLGWVHSSGRREDRVTWTIEALELMDAKSLKLKDLDGLNESQVKELIGEITRQRKLAETRAKEAEAEAEAAKKEREASTSVAERKQAKEREEYQREKAQAYREYSKEAARTIATEIGTGLREGEIATKDVRKKVFEKVPGVPPKYQKPKHIPDIDHFAEDLANFFHKTIRTKDVGTKLHDVVKYQKHLSPYSRHILIGALKSVAEWLNNWIERLDQKKNGDSRMTPAKAAPPHQLKQ